MEPEKSLKNIIVIKLGGSTLGSHDTTLEDLVTLQQRGILPVIAHGGGHTVTEWLTKLNIPTEFVRGLRVTNAETLKVVTAILAGLVNKELVAAIESLGGKAVGLSCIDGGLLETRIKDIDMGYVGEIVKANPAPLEALLGAGFIPVIAPLSLQSPPEPGPHNYILNVNGDEVAAELAVALQADKLIFLTDVAGILDSSGQHIQRLSPKEAKKLVDSGVASGGMIPKIEACLRALTAVPTTRIIDGRVSHALIQEVEGSCKGTTIG